MRWLRAASVTSIMLATLFGGAHAEWSTEPVTITPTTNAIPLVEACADGAHGTFVAWQEGTLRVQHLLPNGDLDSAWPAAGAIACTTLTDRKELVAVPDRLGGLYLLWLESGALLAQRLTGAGTIAPGWPTAGRVVGPSVSTENSRPCVIEDGAHGFYAAWVGGNGMVTMIRIGPDGHGAGGWGDYPSSLGVFPEKSYWPQLALAPDGGVFLAHTTWNPTTTTGSWWLRRLTADYGIADGWDWQGISFGAFHREYLGGMQMSRLGLCPDGRGGVFLVIGNPLSSDGYYLTLETRLYRRQGDGSTATDWPASGRVDPYASSPYVIFFGDGGLPDGSYVVLPGDQDGAVVGTGTFGLHNSEYFQFYRCSSAGVWAHQFSASRMLGMEVASSANGAYFVASFVGRGPYQRYDPTAFIRVGLTLPPPQWSEFGESHPEQQAIQWYGDIGLASTEDGGAVFAWSQYRDRVGLFARKFSPYGEVVPTATTLTSADATSERVRLVWDVGPESVGPLVVYRTTPGSDWSTLSAVSADGSDRVVFEDRDIRAGVRYGYALGPADADLGRLTADVWVDVPVMTELALIGFAPSPASASPAVRFSLPGVSSGSLGVFDLAGRRMYGQDVSHLGPGAHVLPLGREVSLPAGIYLIRLRHGDEMRVARGIVTR